VVLVVEGDEIWQLILRADELVKYSAGEGTPRRGQAVELPVRASEAAEAAGEPRLAANARVRLGDLGAEAPPAQG
jgi:hypothetical protein